MPESSTSAVSAKQAIKERRERLKETFLQALQTGNTQAAHAVLDNVGLSIKPSTKLAKNVKNVSVASALLVSEVDDSVRDRLHALSPLGRHDFIYHGLREGVEHVGNLEWMEEHLIPDGFHFHMCVFASPQPPKERPLEEAKARIKRRLSQGGLPRSAAWSASQGGGDADIGYALVKEDPEASSWRIDSLPVGTKKSLRTVAGFPQQEGDAEQWQLRNLLKGKYTEVGGTVSFIPNDHTFHSIQHVRSWVGAKPGTACRTFIESVHTTWLRDAMLQSLDKARPDRFFELPLKDSAQRLFRREVISVADSRIAEKLEHVDLRSLRAYEGLPLGVALWENTRAHRTMRQWALERCRVKEGVDYFQAIAKEANGRWSKEKKRLEMAKRILHARLSLETMTPYLHQVISNDDKGSVSGKTSSDTESVWRNFGESERIATCRFLRTSASDIEADWKAWGDSLMSDFKTLCPTRSSQLSAMALWLCGHSQAPMDGKWEHAGLAGFSEDEVLGLQRLMDKTPLLGELFSSLQTSCESLWLFGKKQQDEARAALTEALESAEKEKSDFFLKKEKQDLQTSNDTAFLGIFGLNGWRSLQSRFGWSTADFVQHFQTSRKTNNAPIVVPGETTAALAKYNHQSLSEVFFADSESGDDYVLARCLSVQTDREPDFGMRAVIRWADFLQPSGLSQNTRKAIIQSMARFSFPIFINGWDRARKTSAPPVVIRCGQTPRNLWHLLIASAHPALERVFFDTKEGRRDFIQALDDDPHLEQSFWVMADAKMLRKVSRAIPDIKDRRDAQGNGPAQWVSMRYDLATVHPFSKTLAKALWKLCGEDVARPNRLGFSALDSEHWARPAKTWLDKQMLLLCASSEKPRRRHQAERKRRF